MENTIVTDPGDIVRPVWACRRPQIMELNMYNVPNYHRKWLTSAKKSKYPSINIRSSAARTIHNIGIEHGLIADASEYYLYFLNSSQIIR